MKIICKYYQGCNGIIEGEIYECLSDFNNETALCRIKDKNRIFWCLKTCFELLSIHREKQIDEILEN